MVLMFATLFLIVNHAVLDENLIIIQLLFLAIASISGTCVLVLPAVCNTFHHNNPSNLSFPDLVLSQYNSLFSHSFFLFSTFISGNITLRTNIKHQLIIIIVITNQNENINGAVVAELHKWCKPYVALDMDVPFYFLVLDVILL